VKLIARSKEVNGKEVETAAKTIRVSRPHPAPEDGKSSWRDTVYGIGWVPLGGYCDIAGMVDETKSAEDLAAKPEPWEFRTKPAWQRLLVMAGGVMFNFILAVLIYAGIAMHWGERYIPLLTPPPRDLTLFPPPRQRVSAAVTYPSPPTAGSSMPPTPTICSA